MQTLIHIATISFIIVAILMVLPPIAWIVADICGWIKEWPDGDR